MSRVDRKNSPVNWELAAGSSLALGMAHHGKRGKDGKYLSRAARAAKNAEDAARKAAAEATRTARAVPPPAPIDLPPPIPLDAADDVVEVLEEASVGTSKAKAWVAEDVAAEAALRRVERGTLRTKLFLNRALGVARHLNNRWVRLIGGTIAATGLAVGALFYFRDELFYKSKIKLPPIVGLTPTSFSFLRQAIPVIPEHAQFLDKNKNGSLDPGQRELFCSGATLCLPKLLETYEVALSGYRQKLDKTLLGQINQVAKNVRRVSGSKGTIDERLKVADVLRVFAAKPDVISSGLYLPVAHALRTFYTQLLREPKPEASLLAGAYLGYVKSHLGETEEALHLLEPAETYFDSAKFPWIGVEIAHLKGLDPVPLVPSTPRKTKAERRAEQVKALKADIAR